MCKLGDRFFLHHQFYLFKLFNYKQIASIINNYK